MERKRRFRPVSAALEVLEVGARFMAHTKAGEGEWRLLEIRGSHALVQGYAWRPGRGFYLDKQWWPALTMVRPIHGRTPRKTL